MNPTPAQSAKLRELRKQGAIDSTASVVVAATGPTGLVLIWPEGDWMAVAPALREAAA